MAPQAPANNLRRNQLFILAVIIGVLLIGGIYRYYGASMAARSFVENIYHGQGDAALAQVCSDQQDKARPAFQSINNFGNASIDTSQITYTITSESLSSAVITLGGSASYQGQSSNVSGHFTMRAAGLWWCVDYDSLGGGNL